MGSQLSTAHSHQLLEHSPPLEEYQLRHSGNNYHVWQHCLNQDGLIEFPFQIGTSQLATDQVDNYILRHRHQFLVASLFFRRDDNQHKASVFYERVYTNLGRIKDIPFDDSLQFFYVGLRGFELLFRKFGYFEIEESMLHITKDNKVKVWCSKDIFRTRPKSLDSALGSEGDMVRKLIRLIEQNMDKTSEKYPLGPTIYETASHSFAMAISKFREICKQYNFKIPQRITCLDAISKGDVGLLLDEYGEMKEKTPYSSQLENGNRTSQMRSSMESVQMSRQVPTNQSAEVQISRQLRQERSQADYVVEPVAKASRKKSKGLKISHSFENLNSRPAHSPPAQNIRNQLPFPIQSPIKSLTSDSAFINPLPPRVGEHVRPAQHIVMINPNSLSRNMPPSPLHRTAPQFPPPPQLAHPVPIAYQRPPMLARQHPMVRANSVDNLNRTQESINAGSGFRIVINTAERPQSQSRQRIVETIARPGIVQNQLNPQVFRQQFVPPMQQINQTRVPSPIIRRSQSSQGIAQPRPPVPFSNFYVARPSAELERRSFRNQHREGSTKQVLNSTNNQTQKSYVETNEPFKDYTNFKKRFQQFKQNFNYHKNPSTQADKLTPGGKKPGSNPSFFSNLLQNKQTVSSYIDMNEYVPPNKLKKKDSIDAHMPLLQQQLSKPYEAASVHELSENTSSLQPTKPTNPAQWEQSLVMKLDYNRSDLNLQGSKKYEPQIDTDIWADMVRMRGVKKNTINF